MKWGHYLIALAAVLLFSAPLSLSAQGLLELTAGVHRIQVEVANSFGSRAQGLMHRTSLPANGGMLFVFDKPGEHCMWMRNTLIPLSVAFLDEQGRIINIEEMRPQSEDKHCAAKPAKFALEMNGAWFKAKGLAAGSSLSGIDKAPAAR